MEVLVKEITNAEEYEIQYQKYKDDPQIHAKPYYEFRKSIVGIHNYDVIMYRILEQGIIEPDKKEIYIVTNTVPLTAFYSKGLHDELKYIIAYNERIEKLRTEKELEDGKS